MSRARCRRALGLIVALGLAGRAPRAAPGGTPRPKLVVLLVVDQLRADYVDRYGADWKGGLHRLLAEGAWLPGARYPYLETFTCPGHATIGTGTYPHTHGLVLNKWYDRARGTSVECTDDPGTAVVRLGPARGASGEDGGRRSGGSARNLLALTLADQMKAHLSPSPRVVALSMKARSCIGLVGHQPDAAVWFDGAGWVTSSAFTARALPWLQTFLARHPIDLPAGAAWTRLRGAASYSGLDDAPVEKPPPGWARTFPHPLAGPGIRGLERWAVSPAADAYLAAMARAALTELGLGQRASTDLLAISFSVNDGVGHSFGPRSHEVQDVLARLDVTIGELLAALDAQVGRGRYLVALTGDHGSSEVPEQLRAEKNDAGRGSPQELRTRIEAAVVAELGPGRHVVQLQENEVYLAPGVHQRLAARPGAIGRVLAAMRTVPAVADAFDSDGLSDLARVKEPGRRAAALGYFAGRSGDLLFARKPGWLMDALASNHGSLNDYDQRVPVVLYGPGIKPGRHDRPASPADIAPTLGAVIGVDLPRAEGRVLEEVLAHP
jgi:predicted AlkP superfamily pyrophosphatase or phosphodiesterase